MVLRLVLVGLVAGLGITFPGRRDMETLSRSAERWVHAQIAAWDAQPSSEEATFVFLADAPAPAPSEADQPIVSDQEFTALVEEMVVGFGQDELASRPRDAGRPSTEILPVEVSETLAIAPPSEPAIAESTPATATDLAFEAIVDEMASAFSLDLAALNWVAPTDEALEAMMNELARELATVTTTAVTTEVTHQATAATEPVEIAENLYAGEAYELNRISEGVPAPASASAAAPEPGSRRSRLTNAVRLTREAVFAWTSVLHGPAVVAISR